MIPPLHSFDQRLPRPTAHIAAMEQNDGGRCARTGFAYEQITPGDPTLLMDRYMDAGILRSLLGA